MFGIFSKTKLNTLTPKGIAWRLFKSWILILFKSIKYLFAPWVLILITPDLTTGGNKIYYQAGQCVLVCEGICSIYYFQKKMFFEIESIHLFNLEAFEINEINEINQANQILNYFFKYLKTLKPLKLFQSIQFILSIEHLKEKQQNHPTKFKIYQWPWKFQLFFFKIPAMVYVYRSLDDFDLLRLENKFYSNQKGDLKQLLKQAERDLRLNNLSTISMLQSELEQVNYLEQERQFIKLLNQLAIILKIINQEESIFFKNLSFNLNQNLTHLDHFNNLNLFSICSQLSQKIVIYARQIIIGAVLSSVFLIGWSCYHFAVQWSNINAVYPSVSVIYKKLIKKQSIHISYQKLTYTIDQLEKLDFSANRLINLADIKILLSSPKIKFQLNKTQLNNNTAYSLYLSKLLFFVQTLPKDQTLNYSQFKNLIIFENNLKPILFYLNNKNLKNIKNLIYIQQLYFKAILSGLNKINFKINVYLKSQWNQKIRDNCQNIVLNQYPVNKMALNGVSLKNLNRLYLNSKQGFKLFLSQYLIYLNPIFTIQNPMGLKWDKIKNQIISIQRFLNTLNKYPHSKMIFELKPLWLSKNLSEFKILWGKKNLNYQNGPRKMGELLWKFGENLPIQLRWVNLSGQIKIKNYLGNWSVVRLLSDYNYKNQNNSLNIIFEKSDFKKSFQSAYQIKLFIKKQSNQTSNQINPVNLSGLMALNTLRCFAPK